MVNEMVLHNIFRFYNLASNLRRLSLSTCFGLTKNYHRQNFKVFGLVLYSALIISFSTTHSMASEIFITADDAQASTEAVSSPPALQSTQALTTKQEPTETNEAPPEVLSQLDKKQIKEIREKVLEVSQPVFALYMGVSDETIKAWEQGKSKPKGPSLRLLHAAKRGKASFLELISA